MNNIIYTSIDIFQSEAHALVNPVNTVGVMGAGLAKQFKARYSEMYQEYLRKCQGHHFGLEPFDIGYLHIWRGVDKYIINFPTKRDYRNPSQLKYIEAGLIRFVDDYQTYGIESVILPKLGCGKGGLNWNDVKPLMEKYLSQVDIPVWITDYE